MCVAGGWGCHNEGARSSQNCRRRKKSDTHSISLRDSLCVFAGFGLSSNDTHFASRKPPQTAVTSVSKRAFREKDRQTDRQTDRHRQRHKERCRMPEYLWTPAVLTATPTPFYKQCGWSYHSHVRKQSQQNTSTKLHASPHGGMLF